MIKQQRGVALLLVLWVLALLSLLLGGLAGWVQLQTRQAAWHRQHTQALLAAEAGVALTLQALADPTQRKQWVADGREVPLTFDDAQLRVSVRSDLGKLYLNSADVGDFARLALACGATQAQADQLARALEVRRNQGHAPFRVVEELRQLPGMSRALYSEMVPEISLWSGLDRPDPAFASPLMRRALNLPRQSAVGANAGDVLVIDSRAQRPGGYHAQLQVTVLLSPAQGSAQPYRVLRWQE